MKKEFYLLAQKFLAGNATPEEERHLNEWYESFDDSLVEVTSSEDETSLRAKMMTRLKRSLQEAPQTVVKGKTVVLKRWPNWVAATILLFLLLGGMFFVSLTSRSEKELAENGQGMEEENDMYDGPDKAIEFEIERTHDLTTGKVPWTRLYTAMQQTQQSKDQALSNRTNALSWIERGSFTDATGPSNGNTRANGGITSGRIRATMIDSLDPTHKTVWVGGVDGGLWKTTDITVAPSNWTLVNDFLSNLAISAICQDPRPGNRNIMYFCTGESYSNADAVRGVGVFKSIDAGVTWNLLPTSTSFISGTRILCDFQGNVYLGTRNTGLRRSTDGGATWVDITPSGVSPSICDLEISSTSGPGRLHMVTGIFSAQTYRYTDIPATVTTGAGWNAPTTPFATFNNRAEIAVSGNTLYACPDDASHQVPIIYKSTDGGDNWAPTGGQPANGWASGQGWYAISVGINPANPNECIVGGLDTHKTTNGGTSWTKISAWVGTAGQYVHADQHSIQWWDGGNKLLFSCDGGVHFSSDGGTTIRDRNENLRIKQFYSVAIHPTSTNYFIAGAQDNGIHQLNSPGLSSSVEVIGGDGMYVAIDQNEPQFQFGAYVGNVYRRSINSGATWSTPVNLNSGRFVNPWDYDNNGNILYACLAGGNYLRWDNPQTGGTTTTIAVPSFNGQQVSAVFASPYTANRVYFGTGNGRIVRVDNANTATITDVNITGATMPGGYVNSIVTGADDQHLIATFTNYGVLNVWSTTDGGLNWTAIDGNLPDMPVRWALFHPDTDTKAYIATETGVWETDLINGASTVWTASPSFPVMRTDMIKYRTSDRTIAAGTHGRGIWSSTIPPPTGFGFNNPPPATAACPAPASMNITLGTTSAGGFTNPITLSAGTLPLGTGISFTPNPVIPGNSTTVTLTGTNTLAPGSYVITVTGVATGAPNQQVNLTYNITAGAGPAITGQPANQTVCAGGNATFSVTATGTYQWQESTGGPFTNINNGGIYSGANAATLNLTGVTAGMNNNQYRCVVSNPCGSTNSNAALLTVNAATAITGQPANITVCAGNNVSFSVTATGGGLTYQWQESTGGPFTNITNGGIYSNATTATLTLSGVTVGMTGYQYRCIVTGNCPPSPVTSNAATLTVGTALVINSQPANSTVCAGATTSFTVGVTGTVNIYQWQESTGGPFTNIINGGVYSGANTATLTLTGVTAGMNNNQYRCVLTGACPPINSNAATLTVNTAPAISVQPANATLCVGGSNNFCVTASGTNLTYQWELSLTGCAGPWNPIPAAITNCFAVNNVTATQNNTAYRCVINGTCAPAVTTNCALLTVNTPVAITTQPANVTVCAGANASFSVIVTGTSPTYQWQESTGGPFTNITNGGVYSNATTATLTLTGVTAGMTNNQYRCIIGGTAPCGSVTSTAATLTVNTAPAITTQPVASTICLGQSTSFTVTANGTALTYQWQESTNGGGVFNNLANGGVYSGVGTATLTITVPPASMNSYQYRVVISGTCAPPATSNAAILTVNTPVAITTQPVSVAMCSTGNTSFSVVATGTTPGYQWQLSTNGGGSFSNVVNGGVYAGATTPTLSITGATTSLDGNVYRVVVSGTAPCGAVNSANATLTVHALPTVGLTGTPALLTLLPGQKTLLTATPSAGTGGVLTMTWFKNSTAFVNAGNTFEVNVEKIGSYQVKIQEAWPNSLLCSNESPIITIGTVPSSKLFIFPSPNNGVFTVSYYNTNLVSTGRTITIFDSKGGKVYNAKFQVTGPYTLLSIDLTPQQTGIFYVVVGDANGKKLIDGKVLVH